MSAHGTTATFSPERFYVRTPPDNRPPGPNVGLVPHLCLILHISFFSALLLHRPANPPRFTGLTLAFRYTHPEDTWPSLTNDLTGRVGITSGRFYQLVKLFGLRDRDDYHYAIKTGVQSSTPRYSAKTLNLLRTVVERYDVDPL